MNQSERFYELLETMKTIHDAKRHDYANDDDVFATFRTFSLLSISQPVVHMVGGFTSSALSHPEDSIVSIHSTVTSLGFTQDLINFVDQPVPKLVHPLLENIYSFFFRVTAHHSVSIYCSSSLV